MTTRTECYLDGPYILNDLPLSYDMVTDFD